MTQSKKIILLTTSLILTICLMAFFGVYALTTLKNSTFNVGVKYEPEYLVKVEMWIDGANGGTEDKIIDDKEYVEIFNSKTPVSNGMYIQSMSNDTIHINSQTLKPIGIDGEVYFRITSLENETSGKDLKCVIDCGSSTVDSGKIVSKETKILTILTGLDSSTNGTPASSSLGMIKINLKFSEFLLDLKDLTGHDANVLYFGEAGTIETSPISGTTFYVSDINGLLKLSALVGKVDTTKTEYGSKYGYNNSSEEKEAITFKDATIQMLNDIDCGNKDNFSKKFIPIGNSSTNSFRGTFDGNNKIITGLYIDQETDYAGLFGYVEKAEIKNLKMKDCKVVSKGNNVGNFVGYANNSSISNCSAEETEVSGASCVGGIVGGGYQEGVTIVTIDNCYNTGNVSGYNSVGGILGRTLGSSGLGAGYKILNSYNKGNVVGTEGNIGGIIGYQDFAIMVINCYNLGTVKGTSNLGGIIGYVLSGFAPTDFYATIANCYYLKSSIINENLSAIGVSNAKLNSSYYGEFNENNIIELQRGSLPSEWNLEDNQLLTVLNAYRNANPTYNGITLNTWKAGSNGYPVFA